MAYLKGGTFVDGKLYVQDAIVVNKIQTPEGRSLPYLHVENNFNADSKNNSAPKSLVSYSTADGGLDNSPISYDFSEGNIVITFVDSNNSAVSTNKIVLNNLSADIELGEDGKTWKFV